MSYQLKVCGDRKEKVVQQDTAIVGAARHRDRRYSKTPQSSVQHVRLAGFDLDQRRLTYSSLLRTLQKIKIDTIRIRRSLSYIF